MLTQLSPTLPVTTPQGAGYAIAVIDYGQEHHLMWVCVMDVDGEILVVPNPDVKVWTMGRHTPGGRHD